MNTKLLVLEKKYADMKRLCTMRKEKITQLEGELGREKENESSMANNRSSSEIKKLEDDLIILKKQLAENEESCKKWKQLYYSKSAVQGNNQITDSNKKAVSHSQIQTDLDLNKLEEDLEAIRKKYDTAKKVNGFRNETIAQLEESNNRLKADMEVLEGKYTKVKVLCQVRNEELKTWRTGEKTLQTKSNNDQAAE